MSRLRERLNALKPGGDAPAPSPDLRERLQRHGRGRRPTDEQLAQWLNGRLMADGLILVEQVLAPHIRHGNGRLDAIAEALAYFDPDAAGPAVFMDTETTGLSGGTGTAVFLLGLARLTDQGLHLRQYFLTRFQGEAALLRAAGEFLDGARLLVTYNGKGFDHPLLKARYRLAGITDPFAALSHLDLLQVTRRAFLKRWPDCRLHTAERRLLAFARANDLPSAQVPGVWLDWLRRGAARRLPLVLRHNRWDVLSLAALPGALVQCFENPAAHGAGGLAGARQAGLRGGEDAQIAWLLARRGQLDPAALLELARLSRRRGGWDLAVDIWQELAVQGHPQALERLAKYYEHRLGDHGRALDYVRQLLERDGAQCHRDRESRLLGKLTRC